FSSTGMVPLGGDPIGLDSSTTDGNGAIPAAKSVGEGRIWGQPGVAFSLDGTRKLVALRSVVTFQDRNGGPIYAPNHRFWVRLWNRADYLNEKPFLQEVELSFPDALEFETLEDGSILPARRFGAAVSNVPPHLPSYDFWWDLSAYR